jgi:uncharacterized protein
MALHPFVHIEIPAQDRAAAGRFYQGLFGWELQDFPDMNYTTFATGVEGALGGGLNPVNENNPPGNVIVYISTENIQESLQKVELLGGCVVSQPMPIPGVGLFAFFKDPTGNTLALLEDHMDQQ